MRTPARRVLVATTLLLLAAPLFADVAEQRARLPPPARCSDPVEGTWRAHKYFPNLGWSWGIVTLDIRRAGPELLTGRIHVRSWNGNRDLASPPACVPGLMHLTIVQPARGTLRGRQLTFEGTSWQLEQLLCGSFDGSYYLDRYTGTIDPATEEMQTTNNDGGVLFDDPMLFRRIACADTPAAIAPPAPVPPPPMAPPSRACGCQ